MLGNSVEQIYCFRNKRNKPILIGFGMGDNNKLSCILIMDLLPLNMKMTYIFPMKIEYLRYIINLSFLENTKHIDNNFAEDSMQLRKMSRAGADLQAHPAMIRCLIIDI